ncbi:GrpB family protein [Niallia nealsonii]|uniref:GrpB family protein n=1 Tax=Niallia nealsonii TaxID=115979 RepID=UPI002286F1DB|nr:GrpB family protein [Niallia nealsonii]
MFFRKRGDKRTHHIHVLEKGNKEIARHLAFRDYLIAHPKEAQQYSPLRQTLAQKHLLDIPKYIAGKKDYIQEIDEKAKNWLNLQ